MPSVARGRGLPRRGVRGHTPRVGRPGRPLVGREHEAGQLRDALHDARLGRGTVLLVEGEAGMGKTTLVDRVLVQGADDPAAVMVGLCSPTTAASPLRPWEQALRDRPGVLDAPGPADLDGTDAAGALGAAQARRTAARAGALLAAVVAAGPTVLVLEDWHWADATSRALLGEVAAGCRGVPLLLVVTTRPDPAVLGLLRLPSVRHVRLRPLDRDAVALWLRGTGRPAEDADVARTMAASDGLPLLLGATDGDGAGLAAVGASAAAGLGPDETRALATAAVLAGPLDEDLVGVVAGLRPSAVAAAVADARRTGLVVGDGFRHDLVREAVAGLAVEDPARLCRAGAEELRRRGGAPPSRLVELWSRAGDDPACRTGRAQAALDAAREARVSLALDDAHDVLVGALSEALVRDDPALAAQVALGAAQVAFDLGHVQESTGLCETAARAAALAGRGDLLAGAALVCRSVLFPLVRESVQRLAARALDLDPPPDVRSRLLSQLAAVAADEADVARAHELAARSLQLAESTGDPAALLDAYRAQEAVLVEGPGAGPGRLRLGEGTVEQGQRLGQPLAAAIGHGWRLVAGVELARADVVDDAVGRLADLARTGGPFVRWHERRAVAAVAALHGDFATARAASAEAFALATAAGDVVGAGMTGQLSLELAGLRGDAGELADGVDAELALAPPIPVIQVARARVAVLRGVPEDAVPYYEQVMAELDTALRDVRGRGVAFALPGLAVALGDLEGAARLIGALAVYRDHEGGIGAHTTYFFGSPRRELGRLAALLGRTAEAEEHLRAAVRVDLRLRARPQTVLARSGLARLLLTTDGVTSVSRCRRAGGRCGPQRCGPQRGRPQRGRPQRGRPQRGRPQRGRRRQRGRPQRGKRRHGRCRRGGRRHGPGGAPGRGRGGRAAGPGRGPAPGHARAGGRARGSPGRCRRRRRGVRRAGPGPRRAHRAGGRGARPRAPRADEPRDRRVPRGLRAHGGDPREPRPAQARPQEPARAAWPAAPTPDARRPAATPVAGRSATTPVPAGLRRRRSPVGPRRRRSARPVPARVVVAGVHGRPQAGLRSRGAAAAWGPAASPWRP